MRYNGYKGNGERISALGFGIMRLPLKEDGGIDKPAAQKLLDCCMEAGVNYFDTAWNYLGEQSEPFAGEALGKYPRGSYNLATKMPCWLVREAADVERMFNRQLEKCRTDYFDFYLMHNYASGHMEDCERAGAYEYLAAQKAAGRIRRLGLSIHDDMPGLERMLKLHAWDFVQLQINYMDWDLLDMRRQFEFARSLDLPVVIMEPTRGGALAAPRGEAKRILEEANPLITPAEWAMRFVAQLPGVLTVLSGMRSEEVIRENARIFSDPQPLTEEDLTVFKRFVDAYKAAGQIPCTGCRYCMPCPAGVEIPTLFSLYNEFCATGEKWALGNAVAMLGKDKQADRCTACGQCAAHCPQRIPVPEHMRAIAAACVK